MPVVTRNAVRLIDVAKAAGTCRSTASKVLLGGGDKSTRVSTKTAARLRQVAEELGFRPNQIARQLKGVPSKMLGVLVGPETNYINNLRLQAIEDQAYKSGYKLVVGYVHSDVARFAEYLSEFQSRGIDGIICLCHFDENQMASAAEVMGRIKKSVFLDEPGISNASCVIVDRGAGVKEAVEHLYSRGRKRIGLVLSDLKYVTMVQRRRGYLDGIKVVGIEADSRLVYVAGESRGVLERTRTDKLIEDLIVGMKADALIMPDDRWAAQLFKALKQKGLKVPSDIAIVGFDNDIDIVTTLDPELTSIDQQIELMAESIVNMVIDRGTTGRAESENPFSTVIIPSKLVVRNSS